MLDQLLDVFGETLQQGPFPVSRHGIAGDGHDGCVANTLAGPQLDQFHSVIRAVLAGMGAALVPQCLAKDDIAVGHVSTPLPIGNGGGYLSDKGYYLCYPEARRHAQSLVHFREWLMAAV